MIATMLELWLKVQSIQARLRVVEIDRVERGGRNWHKRELLKCGGKEALDWVRLALGESRAQ